MHLILCYLVPVSIQWPIDSMVERWMMVAGTDHVRSSQLLQHGCVGISLERVNIYKSLQICTRYQVLHGKARPQLATAGANKVPTVPHWIPHCLG